MLNAHTVSALHFRGQRLLTLPDTALLDVAERFFERMNPRVFEVYLNLPNGPRTPVEVNALRAYATRLAKVLDAYCPKDVLTLQGVQLSPEFDAVRIRYFLDDPVHVLSGAGLRKLIQFIVMAAEHCMAFFGNPEVACELPGAVYTRRGLPLFVHSPASMWSPPDELWCVAGEDNQFEESGVLEFCVNEFDAQESARFMAQFPARFIDVQPITWGALERAAINQVVKA